MAACSARRYSLRLAWVQRGHEIDLLVLRPECDYPEEIPGGCRLFFLSTDGNNNAGIPKNLGHVSTQTVVPERVPWRGRWQRAARLASRHWKQFPFLAGTRFPGWANGITAYLEHERPDAVLAMHVHAVVATMMAIRLTGRHVRVVATLHKLFRTRSRRSRISGFYPCADVLVGISTEISGRTRQNYGIAGPPNSNRLQPNRIG